MNFFKEVNKVFWSFITSIEGTIFSGIFFIFFLAIFGTVHAETVLRCDNLNLGSDTIPVYTGSDVSIHGSVFQNENRDINYIEVTANIMKVSDEFTDTHIRAHIRPLDENFSIVDAYDQTSDNYFTENDFFALNTLEPKTFTFSNVTISSTSRYVLYIEDGRVGSDTYAYQIAPYQGNEECNDYNWVPYPMYIGFISNSIAETLSVNYIDIATTTESTTTESTTTSTIISAIYDVGYTINFFFGFVLFLFFFYIGFRFVNMFI